MINASRAEHSSRGFRQGTTVLGRHRRGQVGLEACQLVCRPDVGFWIEVGRRRVCISAHLVHRTSQLLGVGKKTLAWLCRGLARRTLPTKIVAKTLPADWHAFSCATVGRNRCALPLGFD